MPQPELTPTDPCWLKLAISSGRWLRRVKIRAGAGRGGGWGSLPRTGRFVLRSGRGQLGRAVRDLGALWNTNPEISRS
jgi:hypothetical protein